METSAHLAALAADSAALLAAARRGLDRPVPGCPGWDVARLVEHTARVHWRIGSIVRTRSLDASGPPDWPPTPPVDARLDWFAGLTAQLVEALGGIDPDTPLWTWAGGVRPARFWFRRAAQETSIHRWDAESAAGHPAAIDAELAADGVDELLEIFLPYWREIDGVRGEGQTLHVHCTDTPGEWFVRFDPGGADVRREHARADCALRGGASDLTLLLWGRRDATAVEVLGDRAVLELWQREVRI